MTTVTGPPAGSTSRYGSVWLPVSCNEPDAGTSSLARFRSSSPFSIMTTDHKPASAGRPPGLARHAEEFSQQVSVGECRYSVPARLIGSRVRVMLSANELRIFDGSKLAAVHPRLIAAGDEHLELDHYLEILVRKPGALPGSAALAQARAAGAFTSAHDAFWAAARARHGERRRDPGADRGAAAAPPDARLAGDRRHDRRAGRGQPLPGRGRGRGPQAHSRDPGNRQRAGLAAQPRRSRAAVITLPARRDPLPPDARPAPSVAAYDQLLTPREGGA